jgi:hypothetical protein
MTRNTKEDAVRHLRSAVLATVAIALCAAPPAGAHDPHPGHAVVTPSNGKLLGEYWAQIYSLPVSENPFAGNGDPCLTVARGVLQEAIGGVTCTVEQGTAFTTAWTTAFSDVEPPPFFGADKAAQRACALAADEATIRALQLSVDGGPPIDIHRRRFESVSPQRTVQLPEDNLLGIDPRTATLTVHGWGAVVRNLAIGQHIVTLDVAFADGGSFSFPHFITVMPRRHAGELDG